MRLVYALRDTIPVTDNILSPDILRYLGYKDYETLSIWINYLLEALRVVKSLISDNTYNLTLITKVAATLPNG